ncbi:MAG TPA: hypothetical protein VGF23_12735 [Gaiellaceae bacterium]|jgi:hypothetical protein
MTVRVIPANVHGAVDHVVFPTLHAAQPPKLIPIRFHLVLDAAAGVALAAAPWLTGTRKKGVAHWLPHALIGAGALALAALTRTEPPTRAERIRSMLVRVRR